MPDTVTWAVTFGLGGEHGRSYTAVEVPAHLSAADQEALVREAAYRHYGRDWAFDYPPARFYNAIKRWDLTLRETITAPEPPRTIPRKD